MHRHLIPSLLLLLSAPCLQAQNEAPATEQQSAAAVTEPNQTGAQISDENAAPQADKDWLKEAGIAYTQGPRTEKLGTYAEIKVPEGYRFVGPEGMDRFLEATHNMKNGTELGVLLAPSGWTTYFEYQDTGYVKDDEKDSLDANELLGSMVKSQEAANKRREEMGWSSMKMQGWATPPHYDQATHNLKWALKLSSSEDDHKSIWINESIRLLGRSGVMNTTLVTNPDYFAESEKELDALLASGFTYVQGEKYSEYKKGDKMAEYGLAALVLGGGVAVAAKSGLLAKLIKPLLLALAAAGAFLTRIFKKLSGKDND